MIIVLIFGMISCTDNNSDVENTLSVAVSIVPQETFVKAVAGDLIDIVTMIPTGYSPANYEPTPKQMLEFSKAKLYFSIGVATEKANIIPMIKSSDSDIKLVSLSSIVDEVYDELYLADHNHENESETEIHEADNLSRDPHIWLSPKRVMVMIEVIKDELILIDPTNKSTYENNADKFINELILIDEELKEIFSHVDKGSFIVYHPSFGYFADDYGLNMVTIEEDGKEATVKRIQEVVDYARQEKIKFIFYQEEFDSKQADVIANEIDGVAIKVAPLSGDYINNMKEMAHKIKDVLEL